MDKLRNPETDLLFEGILTLQTVEECYRFFTDICTIKELQAMTQRLQVARQLREGSPSNVPICTPLIPSSAVTGTWNAKSSCPQSNTGTPGLTVAVRKT